MAKLYDIAERYKNLHELLENEDISPDLISGALNEVEGEFEGKIENICKFMQSLEGEIALIETEELRLEARRKKIEKKYDALRQYMKINMVNLGMQKVETTLFTVFMVAGRDTITEYDSSKLPEKFYKITKTIDKTGILKAVKAGENIEGVKLGKTDSHIRIR